MHDAHVRIIPPAERPTVPPVQLVDPGTASVYWLADDGHTLLAVPLRIDGTTDLGGLVEVDERNGEPTRVPELARIRATLQLRTLGVAAW